MARSLPEESKWEPSIYQIETDTPVLGGDGGPDNKQAEQLANRTAFLRNSIQGIQTGEVPYSTEADANAAIAQGTIPDDAIFSIRSTNPDYWVEEYKNINGISVPTGKKLTSQDYIDSAINQMLTETVISTKSQIPVTFSGELQNGATGWNGSDIVDGPRYGGWQVPIGETGQNTYAFVQVNFNAAKLEKLSGKPVAFVFDITHSESLSGRFSDTSLFAITVKIDDSEVDATVKFVTLSRTNTAAVLLHDVGSEAAVSMAVRFRNSSPLTEPASFYYQASYCMLRTADGYKSNTLDDLKSIYMPPVVNLTRISPKSAEALNGATLNPVTSTITIPSGKSGFNSYSGESQRIHNNRARAGEIVRLVSKFSCSSGFLRTISGYFISMLALRDGIQSANVQVAGSEKLVIINDNSFMIMADYIVTGAKNELASVYFQNKDSTYTKNNRWFRLDSSSFSFISDGETSGDFSRAIQDNRISSGGLIEHLSSVSGEALNGAVLDIMNRTITIPSGSTGYNAYLLFFIGLNQLSKLVGATVRFTMLFETTSNVTDETQPTVNLRVITSNGTRQYAALFNQISTRTGTLLRGEVTYQIVGDESIFAPFIQLKSNIVRTTNGYFKLADLRADILDIVQVGDTSADQMLQLRENILRERIIGEVSGSAINYSATYSIKQDGSGDFASLKAAIAAHGGGTSYNNRVKYEIHSGIYTELNTVIPKYVDIEGIGPRGSIWLKGELPANVDPTQIPLNQTLWMNDTSHIRNLKITAKNMRYPIHSDSLAYSDASIKNASLGIILCHIEHYGNSEAQAYQNSLSSGVTVWNSCHAWGCGLHSGETIESSGTDYFSPTSPFYFHSNGDFDAPCQINIRGGSLNNSDANGMSALVIQNLGAGHVGQCNLDSVTIQGIISVDSNTWRARKLNNQWANRNSEMQVFLHNCSPVAVRSTNDSRALQLISIDSATSSVAVSGTAVAALFGQNPVIIKGGAGYPARVLSAHSVKGEVAGGLIGQRLGDCTAVNKTLTIVFDSGSPVTLTLAANYTAMTNDAVVAALNAQLNDSAGRTFSVITPYNYSAPVYQSDREVILTNTTNVVILKGTAVAFNSSKLNVRSANSGDIRSAIAGIALENIAPGAQGRVQSSGYIHATYVAFTGVAPSAFLATCSVNNDASLSSGGVTAVLQRVGTDVYEII